MIDRVSLPRNDELASQFDLLADLMEIEGADGFRIAAYRKASARIRETPVPVAKLALEGKAKELSGIGKTIEAKIVEVVNDGEVHALTKRKATVPAELASFLRLPGVGPKTVRRMWSELGITTREALQAAAETGALRELDGVGAKLEERILEALARPEATECPRRTLLGNALPRLEDAVAALRAHPAAIAVDAAGSARRGRETVRDLDVIASATDADALIDAFCTLPWVVSVEAKGHTKATVVSQDGLKVDLRVVPHESYGNLLQHFTGSKEHNVALREDAVRRGLSVSEYGVTEVESGTVHAFPTEAEVYRFLGYDWIAPELRENLGELEAARAGDLPTLVAEADLRGDLHTHTTWSDGKDTLDAMVAKAVSRGYDYYAICDHSQRLRDGGFEGQAAAIAALAPTVPLRLLRGVEANIRADGTIDVPDEILAELDWVVASLHHGFDKSPTERLLAAMENPYVDCIGHPTGRKIGKRAPADIDIERVVAKALETGTFLEINAQPDRLDLSDVHVRAAREAGLKLVIDSDGHSTGALDYVALGVSQARRAWLTKADVLNTHTWTQIETLRKRRP
ncbi:MAG: DNA polymerase/3'-5' exonuclease PolX [Actinobacteria bacterium]|uniref:DNA-directed DNA polymerase n=1 Tax=freshwater metagenome TaxID=449393 RepID=A0A6J6NBV7_9ZZZZ|nr:DNA polymerase/3'-5' exonuclease PolX [Actinomycetota bacterium]